jgi:hypothetical protein
MGGQNRDLGAFGLLGVLLALRPLRDVGRSPTKTRHGEGVSMILKEKNSEVVGDTSTNALTAQAFYPFLFYSSSPSIGILFLVNWTRFRLPPSMVLLQF